MLSEKTLTKMRSMKAKKVFIQIPEGLKQNALEISAFLEKDGFDTVTSVEPCFGACDLRDHEAKQLGCDVLLHIGHTDFGLSSKVPVIYDEWASDFDPTKIIKKHGDKICLSVGLIATAQHLASLESVKKVLSTEGKNVLIGKGSGVRDGQVLGCNYSSARSIEGDVDCFIFIGSGSFHLAGLSKKVRKPIFFVDAENGRFSKFSVDLKKEEIKRALRIEKARGMRKFAIFVSTKPGQTNIGEARRLKTLLERKGKDAFIISADMLTPEKILGMGLNVLVNTACPRIYEDAGMFRTIILNPEDVRRL